MCDYLLEYKTLFEKCLEETKDILEMLDEYKKMSQIMQENVILQKASKTKLFGVPFNEIVNNFGGPPKFLLDALEYIEQNCLHEEGLFRTVGTISKVDALKSVIENGLDIFWSVFSHFMELKSNLAVFLKGRARHHCHMFGCEELVYQHAEVNHSKRRFGRVDQVWVEQQLVP